VAPVAFGETLRVAAPRRLGFRELCCALDEFLVHLDTMEIVDESGR
jgi:hypothetical protein